MGYVYILANKNYLGGNLLKIGMTTRTVEKRLAEINGAFGVPPKFYIILKERTRCPDVAEKIIHLRLSAYRVNKRKEFFILPEKDAIRAVKSVCRLLTPMDESHPPIYQKIILLIMVFLLYIGG